MINKIILSLALTLASAPFLAFAGKGAGGQFRYFRTDINASLQRSRIQLANELAAVPESFNKVRLYNQVNLKELSNIVRRLEVNLAEPKKTRMNPAGYEDILMMDYRTKPSGERYIVALEPLFNHIETLLSRHQHKTWFNQEIFERNQLDSYLRRLMLHEALHHFGFDEESSFIASQLEAGLAGISKHKNSLANENAIHFWEHSYKDTLLQLSYWGRNIRHDENPVSLKIPINGDITLSINTFDKKRTAYIYNSRFKSTLKTKCESIPSESGSVFCEFNRRFENGRYRRTVNGEKMIVMINNPLLGNEQYIDGVYKSERPLRIKYRYKINKDEVLAETNIPFFNIHKE